VSEVLQVIIDLQAILVQLIARHPEVLQVLLIVEAVTVAVVQVAVVPVAVHLAVVPVAVHLAVVHPAVAAVLVAEGNTNNLTKTEF